MKNGCGAGGKKKDELAKNSFYGTNILNNDEKILISKWINLIK